MSYTDPCTIALQFMNIFDEIQDMPGEIYDIESVENSTILSWQVHIKEVGQKDFFVGFYDTKEVADRVANDWNMMYECAGQDHLSAVASKVAR